MNKIAITNLDLELYKETLSNGLEIYICPIDKHISHASIMTKYGNDILEYIPVGKKEYKKIPTGTAHFLEHKMFATENGPDPMTIFSQNGASSNAYTTSKITRYYYTASSHFYENLKTLLDCITKPYFTKENIKKEQGIIAQEINAGFDEPEQALYYTTIKNLFQNHPHQYPVAGYINTIKTLTPEDLYDTYYTFYHPSNMFMVITGNVEPEKTINYIKEYYKNCDYPSQNKIETKKYNEPKEVAKEKTEITMDITNTLITKAYKIKINKKLDKFKLNMYTLLYLDIAFGPMSDFYEQIFKDKNILKDVIYYTEIVDDNLIIYFDIEIIENTQIINKIDEILKSKPITEEDFNLLLKNALKSLILVSENVEGMANLITGQVLEYQTFYPDIYEKYKKLNYKEFNNYIDSLDFSQSTIAVIKNG